VTRTAAATGPVPLPARLRGTTFGLVLVITLIAFEAMAVATALPTAVRALHGLAGYAWSFTAFLVATVVGIVTSGEASDRHGARRPLLLGLGLFAVGLVLAGGAPVMAVFVLGRAVQGLGSGLVIVAVYVVIGDLYPERFRPRVFGYLSAAWVLPALVGPVLAGLVAQHLTWRLVFLVLPPFVVAGMALLLPTLRRAPAGPDRAGRRPGSPSRWPFALAVAGGIALAQYAGQRPSWLTLLGAAAGVSLLAVGLRRLLPPGTVTVRQGVPAAIAFRGMLAGSFFAVESLVPLTLTVGHGLSPAQAGAPLTVGALGWSAAAWWQGRHPQLPRYRLVRAGFALVGTAAVGMAAVSLPGAPAWLAYPVWCTAGLGAGLTMPSSSILMLALSPAAERGVNSAALQIADAVTSAFCIGIGGVLVAAAERGAITLSTAAVTVDLLMAGLAGTGCALAARGRAPAPSAEVGASAAGVSAVDAPAPTLKE
jgi:MFS family permease